MFSADNVLINYLRPPVVQMDPRAMGVTAQVAHDLGLSDGQIVQATVQVQSNRVSLVLKGFLIDAPTFKVDAPSLKTDAPGFKSSAPVFKIDALNWNAGDVKSGDTVQLRVSASTNGWVLTPNLSTLTPGVQGSTNTLNPTNVQQSSQNNVQSNIQSNLQSNNAVNTFNTVNLQNNLQEGAENSIPQNINGANTPNVSVNAPSSNVLGPMHQSAVNTGPGQSVSSGAIVPNVIPNWSSRLNTLIFEPAQLSAVFELLMPGVISSLLPQPQLQNWVQRWNANRLSMASLNPTALKNMVLAQSTTIERQLIAGSSGNVNTGQTNNSSSAEVNANLGQSIAAFNGLGGNSILEQDPKTMLKSLSALLEQMQPTPETTKLSHQLKVATHELESAQVQTAQQLMRGELAFHAVIPFWDADPVDLYFKKSKNNKGDDSDHNLTVDIHSKSRLLGEIWLNTSIKQSTNVDLVMWAVKPEVAELARTNATELGYELGVSGLTLHSFQIFNAPKPSEEQLPKPHAGSVLDARV